MGEVSKSLLSVPSVPGTTSSLSSCPRSVGFQGKQGRPTPALPKYRVPSSQQCGLARPFAYTVTCSWSSYCSVVSSVSVHLMQCWPSEALPNWGAWLSVTTAGATNSCVSATTLGTVKTHEAVVSWRNYSFDLNYLLRLIINHFIPMFNGNLRHHCVEIHIIMPKKLSG